MLNYKDEINVPFLEDDFSRVSNELREYLSKKQEGSLVEYILDFCDYNSYRIEDVAEVISLDKELKTLLEYDCIHNKIFQVTSDVNLDEW